MGDEGMKMIETIKTFLKPIYAPIIAELNEQKRLPYYRQYYREPNRGGA